MVGNQGCKCLKHPFHICALKAAGLSSKSLGEIAELAGNPKFKCQTCGAVANRAENLCHPKKI